MNGSSFMSVFSIHQFDRDIHESRLFSLSIIVRCYLEGKLFKLTLLRFARRTHKHQKMCNNQTQRKQENYYVGFAAGEENARFDLYHAGRGKSVTRN